VPFEFFDHTGDIGVRLTAPTLGGLFETGAAALTAVLTDPASVRRRVSETVDVGAPDLDLLLVDWLNELLYRFEARNLLVAAAEVAVRLDGEGCRLQGRVHGEPFDPAVHDISLLVMAVTYHGLHVTETPEGWEATVILDI
jgi:SHS2 domain-containing protein